MLYAQLRREIAVRRLVWYLPGAVLAGALLWGMGRHAALEFGAVPILDPGRPPGLVPALIVIWSWLAGYLLGVGPEWRCGSYLDLALPISPRRLWLTRALATALGGSLIVVAAALTLGTANALAGVRPLLQPGEVSFAIHLAVGLFLTFALLQSPQAGLGRIRLHRGYVTFLVACFAGFLALVLALGALPRIYALVPLAVASVLGIRIYRSLPEAFALVPREADRRITPTTSADRGPSPAATVRAGGFWLLHSTILRSSLGDWTWLYFPLLAFQGWILAGREESTYFSFFFLTWAVLAAWTLVALHGLYRLDPLPISRRRAFAVLAVPALAAVVAGYGARGLALERGDRPVAIQKCYGDYCVRIPAELYEIAWEGEVPAAGSPWGESAEALSSPPFRGSGLKVYNPYSVPRESSADFAALQLSRALAAVYGATVPYQEIRDRYLVTDAEGRVELRAGGAPLLRDHPELRARGRLRTFLLVMLLVGLPWLAFTALVHRFSRGDRTSVAAKWVLPAVFFAVVGIGAGSIAANSVGLVDLPTTSRLAAVLLRQLGDALGAPSLGVLAAFSLLAVYRLAEIQFLRLEAPPAGWAEGPFSKP
jgi:hypothetical protein